MKRPFVSTSCLPGMSYRERLDVFEELAIDRVELGYCPDVTVDLERLVADYSFEFIAHNYFRPVRDEFIVNLASSDDTLRQRSISYVRDGIDFCDRHGIELFTTHAGFRIDPDENLQFETTDVPPASASLETFIESLERILPYADARNVEIAIENNVVAPEHVIDGEPVVLLSEPREFDTLLDAVDVGILLDVGHLNVASETLGFDRNQFVNRHGAAVRAVHLHTNNRTDDQHNPVQPGSWAYQAWRQVGDVPTTVEAQFDKPAALESHLQLLVP